MGKTGTGAKARVGGDAEARAGEQEEVKAKLKPKAKAEIKLEAKRRAVVEAIPVGDFTKAQFLASKQFTEYKDVLNALLVEQKLYTIPEVQKVIEGYLKKEVK